MITFSDSRLASRTVPIADIIVLVHCLMLLLFSLWGGFSRTAYSSGSGIRRELPRVKSQHRLSRGARGRRTIPVLVRDPARAARSLACPRMQRFSLAHCRHSLELHMRVPRRCSGAGLNSDARRPVGRDGSIRREDDVTTLIRSIAGDSRSS